MNNAATNSNVATNVPAALTLLAARWMTLQVNFAEKVLTATPVDEQQRREEELAVLLRREEEFFATLLHELRSPLAPIANALELLASRGDDPKTVIGARGVIQLQLRQLTRLVDDLRDAASGIARGVIELHERVDVSNIIAAAVEAARPTIERQRSWSHSPAPVRPPVHSMARQLDPRI